MRLRVWVIAFACLVMAAGPVSASTWGLPVSISYASTKGGSIASGPDGYLHAAFIRRGTPNLRGLYYATDSSGSWTKQKITGISASQNERATDIAVDSNGVVHIVFEKLGVGIFYWTNRSGSWVSKKLVAALQVQLFPSIAVDGSRKVHVTYGRPQNPNAGLRYATNRSGSWVTTRITTSGLDVLADLAVDSQGKAYVVVAHGSTSYKYLTNRSGSWTSRSLAGNLQLTRMPSIGVDASRVPHVAFVRGPQSASGHGLIYAHPVGGTWIKQNVASYDIAEVALAVDPAGYIHIAEGHFAIRHFSNETGSWVQDEDVASPGQDEFRQVAIAADPAGAIAILYGPESDGFYVVVRGA